MQSGEPEKGPSAGDLQPASDDETNFQFDGEMDDEVSGVTSGDELDPSDLDDPQQSWDHDHGAASGAEEDANADGADNSQSSHHSHEDEGSSGKHTDHDTILDNEPPTHSQIHEDDGIKFPDEDNATDELSREFELLLDIETPDIEVGWL